MRCELALFPDDRRAAVEQKGTIVIWDFVEKRRTVTLKGNKTGSVYCIAVSPDGEKVAGYILDDGLSVWNATSGERLHFLPHRSAKYVRNVVFLRDNRRLAYTPDGEEIILYDLVKGAPVGRIQGHTKDVSKLALSPDGKTLASTSNSDGTVKLCDVSSP